MYTCHAQLLLQRLPSFVQRIADFEHHEASLAILPDYQRGRTDDDLRHPWIAVAAPLLLFTQCERILMDAQFEEVLEDKLHQVRMDLEMVAEGFIGEHEEQQQVEAEGAYPDPRMTDARSEAPAQHQRRYQPPCRCHESDGVGMSDLDTLLEFLRQLGLVVEVRLRLLGVWRRVLPLRHRDRDLSMTEDIEQASRSATALNRDFVGPLARTISNELQVLKYTMAAIRLQEDKSPVQHQDLVLSQMDLRNAIRAWEGGHPGQVLCRTVKEILVDLLRDCKRTMASDAGKTLSFKSPFVFTYSDGPLSHEAFANGINGLEGRTARFAFSFGLEEL
ncbi:unnamed protein product [Scytosiphon promiscuus]